VLPWKKPDFWAMGYDQRCEAYSHAAATVNTKLVLALKTEKLFPRKGAKAQRRKEIP
jgi:hypothetical protein